VKDIILYFIYFVGTLGIATILISLAISRRLGKGTIRAFVNQVIVVMLIFSIAGLLRSVHLFTAAPVLYGINIVYLEYMIFSLTYILASFKLYRMTNTFGFK